jgi:hypothetical protein
VASGGEEKDAGSQECTQPNVLSINGLGEGRQIPAKTGESAPRRIRTYDPLIKSQLLCQLS